MITKPSIPDAKSRTNASMRLSALAKSLSSVINDRQPDSQKQTAETEWRRQRDLVVSLNTVRDVVGEIIALIQSGALTQMTVKGQLLANDGNADVALDPPLDITKYSPGILVTDPTGISRTGLKWDTDLFNQIQNCCGGGINSLDYGHIAGDPVTLTGDYGLVADPPTSSYDFGLITDPP